MDPNMLTFWTLVRCADCGHDVRGTHPCFVRPDVPESNFERVVRDIAEERMRRRR